MTTVYDAIDEHVGRHTRQDLDVHVDGHAICSCGQELDACRSGHCPRCGHRLRSSRSRVA